MARPFFLAFTDGWKCKMRPKAKICVCSSRKVHVSSGSPVACLPKIQSIVYISIYSSRYAGQDF